MQWRNALNNHNPNAMDIGRTRARATMMDKDKRQRIQSGLCFQCNQWGHITRFCPQKHTRVTEATTSSNLVITVQTNRLVSAAQKAQALIATLHAETEEVQNCFAKELFQKKEDF